MHSLPDFNEDSPRRGRKRGRFLDEYHEPASRRHKLPEIDDATEGLPEGDRWSTWDRSSPLEKGPTPYPRWLVTELAAVDTELGVVKTGKEADVYLIRRGVPGTSRSCLLAAKRYRDAGHRMFHRDADYLSGRKSRESRVNRATAKRSAFGREAIASQWANAEFAALRSLYSAGVPVPYPVQITGTELLLEFIGDVDGTAAPRLAETRPSPDELRSLWEQAVSGFGALAAAGLAHGDASAFNVLVHDGRLVIIDLPQVVDVIAHPNGREYLTRDAANLANWFTARGLPDDVPVPPGDLAAHLTAEARLSW